MNFLRRAGFVSLGFVYVAVGALALHLAMARARDSIGGFPAAFRYLAAQPHGSWVVVVIAAGLAAFTLVRLADAADSRGSAFGRTIAFADALGHAALAWAAVALLLRVRRGFATRSALEWILERPWGPTALAATGIAVMAIGAGEMLQGLTGRLRRKLSSRQLGKAATRLAVRVGRFGYVSRGVVTAIIGWFLFRAARDLDARRYRDLGGALGLLQSMRFGSILLGLAGAGLAAYGVYLAMLGLFSRKL